MLLPAQNSMFFLMAHLFSFAGSLIFCTGKWIQKFTETLLAFAFNLHFQQIGLDLHVNKAHHSKER
jgi:hypothetical protein